MRPKIVMWSDYRVPRHKRWRSPSGRSGRSSIGAKILVAALVVVATGGIYRQIVDSAWAQRISSELNRTVIAKARTTRGTRLVATVPFSSSRDAMTGELAVSTPRGEPSGRTAEPPNMQRVAPTELSPNVTTRVSAGAQEFGTTVDPLTKPVAAAAAAGAHRDVAKNPAMKRRVVRTEHQRGPQAYAQYGARGGWNGWPGLVSPYRF
jgi:hypothetical protein